jgi:hypothetical protein
MIQEVVMMDPLQRAPSRYLVKVKFGVFWWLSVWLLRSVFIG